MGRASPSGGSLSQWIGSTFMARVGWHSPLPGVDVVGLPPDPHRSLFGRRDRERHPSSCRGDGLRITFVIYDAQILLATHSPLVARLASLDQLLCFARDDESGTDVVSGPAHPRLRDWPGCRGSGTFAREWGHGMKDLVCVVADRQIEATISALLDHRIHALGIRPITKEMLRHPEKDSGCYWRPTDLLRGYRNQVKRALVILDLDWDGAPAASGAELEFQIEERLSREGMGGWAAPVVIEPELEAWVFSASRHVDKVLGWQDRSPALREALETHGLWKPGESKPADPKAALDWAVKKVGRRRDTPIYRELAQKVSTKRCRDRAFLRLGNLLRNWFPPDLSGNGDTEGRGPSGPHTNSVESGVKTKKKLIEVALPLDAINAASVREKSIRHGHPSTLHLWWARRPLAAARAVIFAQMVDDPSANPDLFPTEAAQEQERRRLFGIIERLVRWENINNEAVLDRAREEVRESWLRTCIENANQPRATELFDPDRLPAFHDPFAGGGALPLEAQRLGLVAYASDLNPVAVLINKAMIEIPPRFAGLAPVNPGAQVEFARGARWNGKGARGLAEDVRYYGQWMRNEAEKRIGHLYPKIEITEVIAKERSDLERYMGRKLTVIAWLWARTVKSPNPAFSHVDIPLVSTFMLSTKTGKEAYVEPRIVASGYSFTVKMGKSETFGTEAVSPLQGTKLGRGANFRCLMSGSPVTGDYIKAEARAGRMESRLMAVVAEGNRERVYLPPIPEMEAVARKAKPEWKPDVEFFQQALGFRIGNYGMSKWSDLFTPRQPRRADDVLRLGGRSDGANPPRLPGNEGIGPGIVSPPTRRQGQSGRGQDALGPRDRAF